MTESREQKVRLTKNWRLDRNPHFVELIKSLLDLNAGVLITAIILVRRGVRIGAAREERHIDQFFEVAMKREQRPQSRQD